MRAFEKGRWIWRQGQAQNDEYVDFVCTFLGDANEKYKLKIAADSNYAVYIGASLVAYGQCADYPEHKMYDEVGLEAYVFDGENRMAIVVWYYGADSQTYIHGEAGLIFEIVDSHGNVVAYSSEETLSRLSRDYVQGRCEHISGQLGFTYHYDAVGYDGFCEHDAPGFEMSRAADGISLDLERRPIEQPVMLLRCQTRLRSQGIFEYTTEHDSPAQNMQYAAMAYRDPSQLISEMREDVTTYRSGCDKGIYFIIDLGEEVAGFLSLDISVPSECRIDIGYGEHLEDGRCRTAVRGFSCTYYAKQGRNVYLNTFRRFGCRYLQVFAHTSEISVRYLGLHPTVYPVKAKKYGSDDLLRNTIYDVCVNTLIQCMHEHYEDCPWREQALYTMDSRNQMLCGYYAFEEYKFPRASLKLISQGQRYDGLLSLCYPAGNDLPIPSFSAVYFVQMNEYIKYSRDTSLAEEVFDVLEKIASAFLSRRREDGCIVTFSGADRDGVRYWNFYEWSPTMDGGEWRTEASVEAPLNAFFSIAMQNMAEICISLGREQRAEYYASLASETNRIIAEKMFDRSAGLFRSFEDRHHEIYSVLTNSLCLLCGAADGLDKTNILKILAANGAAETGLNVVPNTLSMNSFRFDALLREDREAYKDIILNEIDRDYLYMLRQGATSFWEVIEGASAFANAASLCHGWSALPIYYYEILR